MKINVIDEDTGVHDLDKLYEHQQFSPDEFVRYAGTVWRVACINGGYAHIVHESMSKRVHMSELEKIGCEVNDDPYPHE